MKTQFLFVAVVCTACTGPVELETGKDGEPVLAAFVLQSPLCLVLCDTSFDVIGETFVGAAGAFQGQSISKAKTKTTSGGKD